MSGSFVFPREERLVVSREIRTVLDLGNSQHGSRIVLFVSQHPTLSRQVAFIASRRVGNAIHRNRSKRLMREAYRHLRSEYPETGMHLVLVARRACRESTFHEVVGELEQLSAQMNLFTHAHSGAQS